MAMNWAFSLTVDHFKRSAPNHFSLHALIKKHSGKEKSGDEFKYIN